jgi:hypothetical protein
MSGPAPRDWETLRAELEEKGYLAPHQGSFLLRFSLRSLTPGGPLLRLGVLSALLAAGLLSLLLTALASLLYRTPLPAVFLYYLPLLFLLAFATFTLVRGAFRLHPFRTPIRSAFVFSAVLAVAAGRFLFQPFVPYFPDRARPLLLLAAYAVPFVALYPPLRALAFLSWRTPAFAAVRRPRSHWRIVLPVAGVLAGVAWMLAGRMPPPDQRIALPPLDAPLAVLAVDDLRPDDAVFGPSLQAFMRESLIVPVEVPRGMSPAVFWTMVSTGWPPEENGVLSLEAYRLPLVRRALYPLPMAWVFSELGLAQETVASTAERRKPAFWELAAWAGRTAASVNWWTAWPPKNASTAVVANLALLKTVKGEAGTECQPAELCSPPFTAKGSTEGSRWDALVLEAMDRAGGERDLVTAYFPGLDVLLYRTAPMALGEGMDLGRGLGESLGTLDRALERLMESNRRIILIGYSGRQGFPWAYAAFWPSTEHGNTGKSARALDLFPTLLAALRMPVPESAPGKPLYLPWLPREISTIPAYPDLNSPAGTSVPPPVEELRSLGYLQ